MTSAGDPSLVLKKKGAGARVKEEPSGIGRGLPPVPPPCGSAADQWRRMGAYYGRGVPLEPVSQTLISSAIASDSRGTQFLKLL